MQCFMLSCVTGRFRDGGGGGGTQNVLGPLHMGLIYHLSARFLLNCIMFFRHHGSDWQCFTGCLWKCCFINEWVGQPGYVFYMSSHTHSLGLSPVQPGPTSGQNTALRFLHAIPRAARPSCVPGKIWLIICIVVFCKAPLRVEEHEQAAFQLETV